MTGMSGTGKSTALHELRRRGFEVIDTDEPGWTEWRDEDGGYVWREERIAELLSGDRTATLYVAGTVSNQGRFYPRFDAVVLLTAPADVLLSRIESRTTNDYGKIAEERDLILGPSVPVRARGRRRERRAPITIATRGRGRRHPSRFDALGY